MVSRGGLNKVARNTRGQRKEKHLLAIQFEFVLHDFEDAADVGLATGDGVVSLSFLHQFLAVCHGFVLCFQKK